MNWSDVEPSRLAALALGGREEHQHCQLFLNIVEPMLDFFRHVDDASRLNFAVFLAGFESGTAADYVVHLVFPVRTLRITRSSRQHIESGAHRRHAKEFLVQLPLLDA